MEAEPDWLMQTGRLVSDEFSAGVAFVAQSDGRSFS
jgi:hypothetical protein